MEVVLEITDEMVARGGRALCEYENARDFKRADKDGTWRHVVLVYEDWRDEYDEQARAVLIAALVEEA